jgi:hypothetical protein
MINEQFNVTVNKDAERYEFQSKTNESVSYTVGFDEVDCIEDAYIAVYKAIKMNSPELVKQ